MDTDKDNASLGQNTNPDPTTSPGDVVPTASHIANNAIFSSSDLPTATPATAPLPTDPLHPIQTVGTGKGDVWINQASKSKKPLIIGAIILVAVALVGIITAVLLLSNSQTDEPASIVGKISPAIIFDETAPIPIEADNNYGYISPEDGSEVINARFLRYERHRQLSRDYFPYRNTLRYYHRQRKKLFLRND